MAKGLERISIGGFKSIAEVHELELGKVNVIIGANGSGKSNFIEIFSFLNSVFSGGLDSYVGRVGGADQILHFGQKVTRNISCRLWFNDGTDQYRLKLGPTKTGQLFVLSEEAGFWGNRSHSEPFWEEIPREGNGGRISEKASGVSGKVKAQLSSWRVFHFHDTSDSSALKIPSAVEDNRVLRPDGANLAAFLLVLKDRFPESYSLIRHAIRMVAPFFGDFNLKPSLRNENLIRIEWTHKSSDSFFDVSAFSDGTLRFIALATLLLQPVELRPKVIVIDEPELGLHPSAISLLASLIKQASVHTQVIAATQSPLLLDHFQPDEVLVANRSQGKTSISRLDEDSLHAWLEDYSLGELWQKNSFGGKPGVE
ncbi:MAG: AAA family ATPase [Planctomycetes bacterium]|nr:AAA family ATPase [Planctomycetota bacterium]